MSEDITSDDNIESEEDSKDHEHFTSPKFKFLKNYRIKCKLMLLSGLHIGGMRETIEIGGVDNPVIKTFTPGTSVAAQKEHGKSLLAPYIPGSSLKGKIRYLLDLIHAETIIQRRYYSQLSTQEKRSKDWIPVGWNSIVYDDQGENLLKIFGRGVKYSVYELNSARAQFRDAYPDSETLDYWLSIPEMAVGTEIKPENSLDRITNYANPRFFERVIPGATFNMEVMLSIYDGDDEKALLLLLLEGLKLLEDNALGGMGSRGYGRIIFRDFIITKREKDYYRTGTDERDIIHVSREESPPIPESSISIVVSKLLQYFTHEEGND